jgi:hypothetical protein
MDFTDQIDEFSMMHGFSGYSHFLAFARALLLSSEVELF